MLKREGHSIKEGCELLGISRSGYYRILKKGSGVEKKGASGNIGDKGLLERIREICRDHPFWGYRRVRAWLVHRAGISISRKRVYRVMKENGLLIRKSVRRERAVPQRSKPRATRPHELWGIDMTKFMILGYGWAYLVIVLDWYTKKIVGWDISLRSRAGEWKSAIEMAVTREFSGGVRGKGLRLVSDNGSQPTSVSFMRDMATLGIEQIFTTYNNPRGNAETERMMRTIKEEIIWLNEFSNLEEAKERLRNWIEIEYNKLYVHSEIGYMSPEEFEEEYRRNLSGQVA